MMTAEIYYENDFNLGVKFGSPEMSLDADFDIIISCGGQQYRAWRKDGVCYNCTATSLYVSPKPANIPAYDYIAVVIPVNNHGLGVGQLAVSVGAEVIIEGESMISWGVSKPPIYLVDAIVDDSETEGIFDISVAVGANVYVDGGAVDLTNYVQRQELKNYTEKTEIASNLLVQATSAALAQSQSASNPDKIYYTVEA